MDLKKLEKRHDQINELLDNTRVLAAIAALQVLLEETGVMSLIPNLKRIKETYQYMVGFMLDGIPDSGREAFVADTVEQLRSLADMAVRNARSVSSPEYYYSVMRLGNLRKESLAERLRHYGRISSELALADAAGDDTFAMRKDREECLNSLFDSILTSLGENSEYAELTNYLVSGYADNAVASLSLSAMTLSLLFFYDKGKLTALLDIYDKSDDVKIASRALTGIVLAMIPNRSRIEADKSLMARLQLMTDDKDTDARIREVVRVIIGTRDTERVANKMRDEVIPELQKMKPDLMKFMKENQAELDAAMLENNPEWEDLLNKSSLSEKMRELSELQSEGADVMMITFSHLKQFPFFAKASNWFLPFDADHTDLHVSEPVRKLIGSLSDLGAMACDSDLYSLAFASSQIPEAQIQMMASQINANWEQLQEETKSEILDKAKADFGRETLRVARDLYRFFKLFRKKEGFADPFLSPLDFLSLPAFGALFETAADLSLYGEFYFKRGYYSDALPLLEKSVAMEADNATLWEKIGFCHQAEGRFVQALDAYEKATLFGNASAWLTNKLAYVNRKLGNYAEAGNHYMKALEENPENLSLLMNVGSMLLEQGDVEGALTHFYHADYLKPENLKVMRAIGWCELLNGNFDKAADRLGKVLSAGAVSSDYLNAGHCALLKGQPREALNLYRLAAEKDSGEFGMAFDTDASLLVKLGADPSTLLLLKDLALDKS